MDNYTNPNFTEEANMTATDDGRDGVEDGIDTMLQITRVGIAIGAIGLILDFAALAYLIKTSKRPVKPRTILIANILVCDALIAVSTLTMFVLKYYQLTDIGMNNSRLSLENHERRMTLLCDQRIVSCLWNAATMANFLAVLLISLDHFIAIRFSMKHTIIMSRRVVVILIVISAIVAFIIGFYEKLVILGNRKINPLIDEYQDMFFTLSAFCIRETFYRAPGYNSTYYYDLDQEKYDLSKVVLDLTFFTVVLVLLTATYCYIVLIIFRVSKHKRRQLQTSHLTYTKDNENTIRKSEVKGLCTSVLFVVTFIALWLPNVVVNLPVTSIEEAVTNETFMIMAIVCSCTAISDFLIYFLRSKRIDLSGNGANCCQVCLPADVERSQSTGRGGITSPNVTMVRNRTYSKKTSSTASTARTLEDVGLVKSGDDESRSNAK